MERQLEGEADLPAAGGSPRCDPVGDDEDEMSICDALDWVDISYTAADGTPRQTNGFDCGMFMSRTAEYLVRDAVLDFTQADMPNLRRRMVFELSQKALTD